MLASAELVATFAIFLAPAVFASEQATLALEQVKMQVPNATWQAESASADFDCDGRTDHAFLVKRGEKVIVAFAVSSTPTIQSFAFGVAAESQESICEEPAGIVTESLEYDPSEAVDGVEGFQLSKTCKGLQLIGGECDFFHFYWNHIKRRVEWWRL
jgi:hypothetical protein